MAEENKAIVPAVSWKTKVLVTGAVVGAAAGLAGAYLYTRRKEEANNTEIPAGDMVRITFWVFGLLRSIYLMGD